MLSIFLSILLCVECCLTTTTKKRKRQNENLFLTSFSSRGKRSLFVFANEKYVAFHFKFMSFCMSVVEWSLMSYETLHIQIVFIYVRAYTHCLSDSFQMIFFCSNWMEGGLGFIACCMNFLEDVYEMSSNFYFKMVCMLKKSFLTRFCGLISS